MKEVPPPVKAQYFTNLDSPYIVSIGDTALEQQTIDAQVQKDPINNKICNIDTPYSPDGTKCIKCNPPEMYFDYKKKICVGCLDNQFLDADGNCVDSPLVSNVAAITASNKYIETQPDATIDAMNQNIQNLKNSGSPYLECSQSQPYYNPNTKSCTSLCSAGQYLDLATAKCIPCTTYDAKSHSCPLPVVNYADLSNPNWIAANPAAVTQQRDSLKSQPGSQICPSTAPFLSNGNCVGCIAATPYFNYDTKKCEACAVFSPNTHTCSQVKPNPQYPDMSDPNWTTSDINQLTTWIADLKSKPGATICPNSTPHYNGASCVACANPTPLFNYDTKKCEACQAPKVFDANVHQCITKLNQGLYQTNPNSPLLIYRQPYQYW